MSVRVPVKNRAALAHVSVRAARRTPRWRAGFEERGFRMDPESLRVRRVGVGGCRDARLHHREERVQLALRLVDGERGGVLIDQVA